MKVADVVGVAAGCMFTCFVFGCVLIFFQDATTKHGAVCVAQRVFEFGGSGNIHKILRRIYYL